MGLTRSPKLVIPCVLSFVALSLFAVTTSVYGMWIPLACLSCSTNEFARSKLAVIKAWEQYWRTSWTTPSLRSNSRPKFGRRKSR